MSLFRPFAYLLLLALVSVGIAAEKLPDTGKVTKPLGVKDPSLRVKEIAAYKKLVADLSLNEARVLIERWRQHYNTKQPHSTLGYRPPAPEAIALVEACFDPLRSLRLGALVNASNIANWELPAAKAMVAVSCSSRISSNRAMPAFAAACPRAATDG